MDWDAIDAIGEFVGAIGSLVIACVVAYIATRQWLDGKRFERQRKELTEEIEKHNQEARAEQERIVRAQSLDSYFDGISTLLLRDEDGVLTEMARSLTKGRTDAILKILKSDEKRNLVAFLYGSGLISWDGDGRRPVVGLSGSDLSQADLKGSVLRNAGLGMANLRQARLSETELDEADLRGADLTGADLKAADLSRANLHGVIASAADFTDADLSNSEFSGGDLRGADLGGADLTSANLSGSNLRGANLTGARLGSANLDGANLREAKLAGAELLDTQLSNLVSIEGADFTGALNLAAGTRSYLCSIASGAHPDTGRDTRATLGCS